jgi:small subunit ribosomal protein S21
LKGEYCSFNTSVNASKGGKRRIVLQVIVGDQNRLEVALKVFKKKVQREGIVREGRRRKEFEKPSEKAKRKRKESISRMRKKRR